MEHVHVAHSVVETVITLLVIILRMANTRMGYVEVQLALQRLQHFDPVHEPHLRAVWTWMWLLLAVGVINLVICIICFVVFEQLVHLGWTLLSNQLSIVTMKVLSELYEFRALAAVNRIKEDQQKASVVRSRFLNIKPSASIPPSSLCTTSILDRPTIQN